MYKIFVYGSHLWDIKFLKDIETVGGGKFVKVGRARLTDHKVVCNKKSQDGSSKANIEVFIGYEVLGIVYELDEKAFNSLKKEEGSGYLTKEVEVLYDDRKSMNVIIFKAKSSCLTSKPAFTWYKELIIKGAITNNFPKSYVDDLQSQIIAESDYDTERENEKRKKYKLNN